MDQAQCEANGCVYVTELDGEVSCEEPELEAGEVAEPDEAAEDAAELAEEQNELQNGEEAAEAAEDAAELNDPEEAAEANEPEEAAEAAAEQAELTQGEDAAELQEDQAEAQVEAQESPFLNKAQINWCDCSAANCAQCMGMWEVDAEDGEGDCKNAQAPPAGATAQVTACTEGVESELDAEDQLEGELPEPEDTIPEVEDTIPEVEDTIPEVEEPEYEDIIPGQPGLLRKPHANKEDNGIDIGSWFLLGCTFLISVIFSIWCVTKTVDYFDHRQTYNNIHLETLTEDFYNYESLA